MIYSSNCSYIEFLLLYSGTMRFIILTTGKVVPLRASDISSSILYFLSHAPSGVMRLSPATDTDDPPWCISIVRNLYKVKSLPSFPTRFCLNKAGPSGIIKRISSATTYIGRSNTTRPQKATTISNTLLPNIP